MTRPFDRKHSPKRQRRKWGRHIRRVIMPTAPTALADLIASRAKRG